MAQIFVLNQSTDKKAAILIDDLASALDVVHRNRLIESLQEASAQVFVTTTEKEFFSLANQSDSKLFHVEHGEYQ